MDISDTTWIDQLNGQIGHTIEGMTPLKQKIIELFDEIHAEYIKSLEGDLS